MLDCKLALEYLARGFVSYLSDFSKRKYRKVATQKTNHPYVSKYQNYFHSFILFLALLVILAAIGWLVAGISGVVWAFFMICFLIISISTVSPGMLLRLYQTRALSSAEAPVLYEIVTILCQRAEIEDIPIIHYVPSSTLNSFTTGIGKKSVIAISDGMLQSLNARELIGVIAHEISHVKNNDIWVMSLADIISRLTSILATFGYMLVFLYLPLYLFTSLETPWSLVLLLMLAPHISAILQLALSRSREFAADLVAAELSGDALGLASALKKIEYYKGRWINQVLLPNRGIPDPSLLRTHPKTQERIARLVSFADQQQASGLQNIFEQQFNPPESHVQIKSPRRRIHGLWY